MIASNGVAWFLATGNTPVMEANPFSGMRTLSANIAVELPEAAIGHTHFRALFLGACCLFFLTFVINTLAAELSVQPAASAGIADRHFHPAEPRTLRLTAALQF